MKKLIMFVMVIAIVTPALAELGEDADLNLPDWAGAPGTLYGYWDFAEALWEPGGESRIAPGKDQLMEPHATNPDPEEFEDGGYMYQYEVDGGTHEDEYEDREGVLLLTNGLTFDMQNFPGEGTKLIRIQMTMYGDGRPSWLEVEASGGYSGGGGDPEPISEPIDLGDGWFHVTYEFEIPANPEWEGLGFWDGPFVLDQVVIDTICYTGDLPTGPGRGGGGGIPNPIIIDPNESMVVYEEGETESGFGVSLRNEPPSEATITVTVDPNSLNGVPGKSEDIMLVGGDPCNGTITFIFDANNYDIPQMVIFKAIDDDIPDYPEIEEQHRMLVSSSWPEHPTDANFVGEKSVSAIVYDNDQANMLLTYSPVYTSGGGPTPETSVLEDTSVKIWEQLIYSYGVGSIQKRNIGVTLQVEPVNDEDPCLPGYVRIIVTNEGGEGNPMIMNPPLVPYDGPVEPNAIVFTSDGNPVSGILGATTQWDVPYTIQIWADDDDELQAWEAYNDGDQYYYGYLVFWVESSPDERYSWTEEGDEGPEEEGMERAIEIEIEDNECGALGISYLDVSNPYYLMDEDTLEAALGYHRDPNDYADDDGNPLPDCYVDMNDVIEFLTQWLECSDPQDLACESYQ